MILTVGAMEQAFHLSPDMLRPRALGIRVACPRSPDTGVCRPIRGEEVVDAQIGAVGSVERLLTMAFLHFRHDSEKEREGRQMDPNVKSFYFFDFDKNIMKVKVNFVITNTATGEDREMPASEYFSIKDALGQDGEWRDWNDDDALRYYRDLPGVPAAEQPFVKQIEAALDSGDGTHWQAPSWGIFVHVCNAQKPMSLITARGHSDDTVKAGFQVLKDRGWIEQTPRILTLYNVNYPPTLEALSSVCGKTDVQDLKLVAIHESVDAAVAHYGAQYPHHFGMSDDTMTNVEFIADAMRQCREKYPTMRFFVICTNLEHLLKAEIFPLNVPVAGHGDPDGGEPLTSHLGG